MRERRGVERLQDLARGPGRLTVAMGVGLHDDGLDLCGDGALWLGTEARSTGEVGVSIRIGITREAHRPLRFFERGSRFVSGPGRLNVHVRAPLPLETENPTQRRRERRGPQREPR